MLNDLDLAVASVRFTTRHGYDCQENLDRRLEATRKAMAFAYSLGSRVLINAVGCIPADRNHPSAEHLAASLSDLARHGERVGVALGCETGTEPADRLAGFIRELDSGAIGIHFNPASLILSDHYDADSIRTCASQVISVAVRDAVRDRAKGRGFEVEIGRGSAEFPNILGVLEEHNYRGWFIIDRPAAADVIPELSNAIAYLNSL